MYTGGGQEGGSGGGGHDNVNSRHVSFLASPIVLPNSPLYVARRELNSAQQTINEAPAGHSSFVVAFKIETTRSLHGRREISRGVVLLLMRQLFSVLPSAPPVFCLVGKRRMVWCGWQDAGVRMVPAVTAQQGATGVYAARSNFLRDQVDERRISFLFFNSFFILCSFLLSGSELIYVAKEQS